MNHLSIPRKINLFLFQYPTLIMILFDSFVFILDILKPVKHLNSIFSCKNKKYNSKLEYFLGKN
jgi:hypothetical protein